MSLDGMTRKGCSAAAHGIAFPAEHLTVDDGFTDTVGDLGGTPNGDAVISPEAKFGAGTLKVDGDRDYVDLGDTGKAFAFTGDLTASTWVKTDAAGHDDDVIIGKGWDNNQTLWGPSGSEGKTGDAVRGPLAFSRSCHCERSAAIFSCASSMEGRCTLPSDAQSRKRTPRSRSSRRPQCDKLTRRDRFGCATPMYRGYRGFLPCSPTCRLLKGSPSDRCRFEMDYDVGWGTGGQPRDLAAQLSFLQGDKAVREMVSLAIDRYGWLFHGVHSQRIVSSCSLHVFLTFQETNAGLLVSIHQCQGRYSPADHARDRGRRHDPIWLQHGQPLRTGNHTR